MLMSKSFLLSCEMLYSSKDFNGVDFCNGSANYENMLPMTIG